MNIIVITPPENIASEPALVNQFFANGLQRLHLRKKNFELAQYSDYISRIEERYHAQISIHEHFTLVQKFDKLGIHLNSHVRAAASFMTSSVALNVTLLSTSFHSWNEIATNKDPFNYVFISPVQDSISKEGYKASIDLSGVTRVKEQLKAEGKACPAIIALGGVAATNVALLHQYKFDGVAVLGAIWQAADPLAAFLEINQKMKQLEGA